MSDTIHFKMTQFHGKQSCVTECTLGFLWQVRALSLLQLSVPTKLIETNKHEGEKN